MPLSYNFVHKITFIEIKQFKRFNPILLKRNSMIETK